MITHLEIKDGYAFFDKEQKIAEGVFDDNQFHLLYGEQLLAFNNAMQAMVHLRSLYEPKEVSPKTLELFTKPARLIDNMSRWKNNPALIDMPKEVFYANLPR